MKTHEKKKTEFKVISQIPEKKTAKKLLLEQTSVKSIMLPSSDHCPTPSATPSQFRLVTKYDSSPPANAWHLLSFESLTP